MTERAREIGFRRLGLGVCCLAWLCLWPVAAALAGAACQDDWPGPGRILEMKPQSAPAVVGEPIAFEWRINDVARRGSAAFEVPVYLVLLAPEATRFEGRGFFALAPGARGPYGMSYGSGRARAIVPLHTRFAAPAGRIDLLAYRAETIHIEWAIVQADGCGERLSEQSGQTAVAVRPGAPQLVARDEFAARRPSAAIAPLRGSFRAWVFDGAVEVKDVLTGEVVLQAAGYDPVFSPSGRFLTLKAGEEQICDVFDLVAGRRLGRFQSIAMYWSHADSFLYLDQEWEGEMQIVRTLHGRREALEEAPRMALPLEFNLEDVTLPENAVHAGPDPASDDIDPGAGGGSFTAGSEAWSLELSVEGGVAAFLNTNEFIATEPTDEMAGAVVDLGLKNPMVATSLRSELEVLLGADFGVTEPTLDGWTVHEKLRRTFAYHEEQIAEFQAQDPEIDADPALDENVQPQDLAVEKISYADEPTQTVVKPDPIAANAADGEGVVLRGAVGMATSARSNSATAGAKLDLLPDVTVKEHRSGEDEAGLDAVASQLDALYADDVASFSRLPVDEALPYRTEPFPVPRPATKPDEPALIDLHMAGRDSWAWALGSNKFWLTQTVESGRLSHAFSFTLLGLDGTELRQADLLGGPGMGAESVRGDEPDGALGLIVRGDARDDLGATFSEPSFVAIAAGRYLLVATRPVVRLIAFDLARWQPICVVRAPIGEADIDRLALTGDARHLVQINRNGQVGVYTCADGTRLLSGLIADDELVVMDSNGYFDGSEDAGGYVELKIAGLPGRHLLSQFAGRLRVHGLAETVLRGTAVSRPPLALDPPSLSVAMDGGEGPGRLTFAAQSGIGLKSLDIFVNGRLAKRIELNGVSATASLSTNELPNADFVTALALDKEDVTSPPMEIRLRRASGKSDGRLIGLAVGVDRYPLIKGGDLRFAASDARRIAASARLSKLYSDMDVETLIDGQATSEAILGRLDGMVTRAGENDTILLAFAGHGLLGENGKLRLGLSSTDVRDLDATSLDFEEVVARVKTTKARVILLLDACHSGVSGYSEAATNDVAVRQLATAGGAGIVILSASKGRQFSEELATIGGGRFSVAIERVLTQGRTDADSDGNGNISLLELYRGIKTAVAGDSQGRQIPWIARNQIYGDFDVF